MRARTPLVALALLAAAGPGLAAYEGGLAAPVDALLYEALETDPAVVGVGSDPTCLNRITFAGAPTAEDRWTLVAAVAGYTGNCDGLVDARAVVFEGAYAPGRGGCLPAAHGDGHLCLGRAGIDLGLVAVPFEVCGPVALPAPTPPCARGKVSLLVT